MVIPLADTHPTVQVAFGGIDPIVSYPAPPAAPTVVHASPLRRDTFGSTGWIAAGELMAAHRGRRPCAGSCHGRACHSDREGVASEEAVFP